MWTVIDQRGAAIDPNLRFYNLHLLKSDGLRPGSAPSNWVTELHHGLVSAIVPPPSPSLCQR